MEKLYTVSRARSRAAILAAGGGRGRHLGVGRPALAPGLWLAPWGSGLFSKLPDPDAVAAGSTPYAPA